MTSVPLSSAQTIQAPYAVDGRLRTQLSGRSPKVLTHPYVKNMVGSTLFLTGVATTNASPVVTMTSTTGLGVGWSIVGVGIPPGALIASVDSGTQIHLGNVSGAAMNATATATGLTMGATGQAPMGSPPTITHNTTSQFTGGTAQHVPPNSPVFKLSGGLPITNFGPAFDVEIGTIVTLAGGARGINGAGLLVSFDFVGRFFEFRQRGAAANVSPGFRLWVNERPHATFPEVGNTASASISSGDYVDVDLGSVGYWRIVIEMVGVGLTGNNPAFYGVSCAITDTIMPASIRTSKLVHVGDSFGQAGTPNTGDYGTGFVHEYARRLGINDISNSTSLTSTGPYWASSAYPGYLQRVAQDVIPQNPDVVVVQGSINDNNALVATIGPAIQEAVTNVLELLKSKLPNAIVVMTSPLATRAGATNQIAVGNVYEPVCAALGIPYIDGLGQYGPAWFTGTGTAYAPVGDGNADHFSTSDGVHPNAVGHYHLGRLIAHALAPILGVSAA